MRRRLAAIEFHLASGKADELSGFLRHGRTHSLTKGARERFPIVTFTRTELRTVLEPTGFRVVDLMAKTVLPMRGYRTLPESPEDRRHCARLEKKLCRDGDALGRALHDDRRLASIGEPVALRSCTLALGWVFADAGGSTCAGVVSRDAAFLVDGGLEYGPALPTGDCGKWHAS